MRVVHCSPAGAVSQCGDEPVWRGLDESWVEPPLLFEWANEAKPLVKAWAKALLRAAAKSDAPSARD